VRWGIRGWDKLLKIFHRRFVRLNFDGQFAEFVIAMLNFVGTHDGDTDTGFRSA
jgi:hypothetical protein